MYCYSSFKCGAMYCIQNFSGANGEVRYSLDKSDTSVADFFYIDTEDGSIFLKRSLDHETQTLHHIIVIATDNGVPSLSNTVHVWVEGTTLFLWLINIVFQPFR